MAPTWVLSAPDGPHVGPMNLAIRVHLDSWVCHTEDNKSEPINLCVDMQSKFKKRERHDCWFQWLCVLGFRLVIPQNLVSWCYFTFLWLSVAQWQLIAPNGNSCRPGEEAHCHQPVVWGFGTPLTTYQKWQLGPFSLAKIMWDVISHICLNPKNCWNYGISE